MPMKRTPLKRTAWPRKTQKHEQVESHKDKAQAAIKPVAKINQKPVGSMAATAPILKTERLRDEGYRRKVAALPCIACGIQGYSQAAHVPPDARGVKQGDDLTFPLCCTRPGVNGCHVEYDQFRMFPKREAVAQGHIWAEQTAIQLGRKP